MKLKTKNINQIYEDALSVGAIGKKLLSPGGAGYLLFFVKHKNQKKVKKNYQNLNVLIQILLILGQN